MSPLEGSAEMQHYMLADAVGGGYLVYTQLVLSLQANSVTQRVSAKRRKTLLVPRIENICICVFESVEHLVEKCPLPEIKECHTVKDFGIQQSRAW